MRLLVTGGAGFIGSHLCDRLIRRGDQVWCVDNLYLGHRRNIAHLEESRSFAFVKLDLLDESALDALCLEVRFDGVFHLAANSDIAGGCVDPRLDFRLNEMTTVNVLQAMQAHRIKRLFLASTSAVFGETDTV